MTSLPEAKKILKNLYPAILIPNPVKIPNMNTHTESSHSILENE